MKKSALSVWPLFLTRPEPTEPTDCSVQENPLQVERLARAAQSSCDAGNRELFAELKTAVSRVEELQSQAPAEKLIGPAVGKALAMLEESKREGESLASRRQEKCRQVGGGVAPVAGCPGVVARG